MRGTCLNFLEYIKILFTQSRRPGTTTGFHVSCDVDIIHRKSNGRLIRKQRIKNLVVDQGLDFLTNIIAGNTIYKTNYIGLSDSTTPVIAASTNLPATIYTSFGLERALGTYAVAGTGAFTMTKVFTCTADNKTVNSAGLYTESTGDKLFAGLVLTYPVTLKTNETISVSWTISFTGA
jgi:hypothetical protein